MTEVKQLKYTLDDVDSRKAFIDNEESSLYGGVNSDGERVSIKLEKGEWLTITTYQENGWVRVEDYNQLGLLDSSTYDGRWNQ